MIVLDTNIKAKGASAQYTSFNYNSMVKFRGSYFCADSNGLYKITGGDDNGTNIVSYCEPFTTDFGIDEQKRLRCVYLALEADGDMSLKVTTEESSQVTYTIPASSGQQARKVNINRSQRGRWWTFQVYGDGVIYALDELRALVIVRGHGFDKN